MCGSSVNDSCNANYTGNGKALTAGQKLDRAEFKQRNAQEYKADLQKKASAKIDKKAIIVDVLGEVSGINDILKCIDGSASSCLMSVGGVLGGAFFKAAKLAKKVKRIQESISAFGTAQPLVDSCQAASAAM